MGFCGEEEVFGLNDSISPSLSEMNHQDRMATRGGIGDQYMGCCADDFAILQDGRAAHECVKADTTRFLSDFQPILTQKCSFGSENE